MIRQGFALFDMDGTVTRGDSIMPMIRYAVKTKFAKAYCLPGIALAYLGYFFHIIDDTRAKEMALSFLCGKTSEEVNAFAESFCQDVLIKRIYPCAREEMKKHREEGRLVVLVTASPDFYLKPLVKELDLSGVIGTRADITPDGMYTGHIGGRNCRGIEKPLRIAEYLAARGYELDTDNSYAYGDSGHDWHMMSLVKHPVAVNAKKSLRKKCGSCQRAAWKMKTDCL